LDGHCGSNPQQGQSQQCRWQLKQIVMTNNQRKIASLMKLEAAKFMDEPKLNYSDKKMEERRNACNPRLNHIINKKHSQLKTPDWAKQL